ncbi:hypothetical protein HYV49_03495, partial [Candidatus Pacearchaeota archaeon]|nr:hypothetical protein [Candidatus Pacearchaeota archaeon]
MPGVVTPLLTLIHDCDTVADWTGTPSADSTVEWQGNACLAKKVSNATSVVMLKPITGSVGQPADFTDVQIYVWMQGLKIAQFDTRANGGMRIVVESGTTAGTWQGVWSVGGSDTYNGGWQNFSIRTSTPFSSSTSTPPNKQFISRVGVQ